MSSRFCGYAECCFRWLNGNGFLNGINDMLSWSYAENGFLMDVAEQSRSGSDNQNGPRAEIHHVISYGASIFF